MHKFRVRNSYAMIGALIFCLALSACRRPAPRPILLSPPPPSASPQFTPLPALAERCISRPGAVWHTWRTAQNPSADGRIWVIGDRGIAVYDPAADKQP